MCEFKVFLDEKKIFEDTIFCRIHNGTILLKDILGQTKELANCHVVEVDVTKERIVVESDSSSAR